MKRLLISSVAVAAMPAAAGAANRDHVPGCATASCDKRIGKRWARNHPRARKATVTWRQVVEPYQAFLAKLRACEAGGQPAPYQTNTGNGFYGAYQFALSSWAAVGGHGNPAAASPLEQDYRAVRLLKLQGPGAWPVCSR
jgi:hypothetical protein